MSTFLKITLARLLKIDYSLNLVVTVSTHLPLPWNEDARTVVTGLTPSRRGRGRRTGGWENKKQKMEMMKSKSRARVRAIVRARAHFPHSPIHLHSVIISKYSTVCTIVNDKYHEYLYWVCLLFGSIHYP